MTSPRGNTIANQFIITTPQGKIFQSYSSIITIKYNDWRIELDETYRDYSTTTGKYRNIFLREYKKETEEKIKSGIYSLTNLN